MYARDLERLFRVSQAPLHPTCVLPVTAAWLGLLWGLTRRAQPRIDQITCIPCPGRCACAGAGTNFLCDQKWQSRGNSWTLHANLRACLPQ